MPSPWYEDEPEEEESYEKAPAPKVEKRTMHPKEAPMPSPWQEEASEEEVPAPKVKRRTMHPKEAPMPSPWQEEAPEEEVPAPRVKRRSTHPKEAPMPSPSDAEAPEEAVVAPPKEASIPSPWYEDDPEEVAALPKAKAPTPTPWYESKPDMAVKPATPVTPKVREEVPIPSERPTGDEGKKEVKAPEEPTPSPIMPDTQESPVTNEGDNESQGTPVERPPAAPERPLPPRPLRNTRRPSTLKYRKRPGNRYR